MKHYRIILLMFLGVIIYGGRSKIETAFNGFFGATASPLTTPRVMFRDITDGNMELLTEYFKYPGMDANVAMDGEPACFSVIRKDNRPVLELLIKHRLNVNKPADSGQTPLQLATELRRYTMYKMLVAAGAIETGTEKSRLDEVSLADEFAAMLAKKDSDAALWILKVDGLPSYARDSNGSPLLYHALMNGTMEVVEALVEGGADPNADISKFNKTPVLFALLTRDDYESTSLVKRFLAQGIDLTQMDPCNRTLLAHVTHREKDRPNLIAALRANSNALGYPQTDPDCNRIYYGQEFLNATPGVHRFP